MSHHGSILTTCGMLILVTGVLHAAEPVPSTERTRPEQRVGEVAGNDVYVRSGPSANHYTITKLDAGTRVTILGEQGDWYEIAPPKGVFSLISGDYVTVDPDGVHGVVNGNRVRVRAGSLLNDNKYTVQLMLDKGAEVTVLERNPDGFLRIEPPPGATLWISKRYITIVPPERLGHQDTPDSQTDAEKRVLSTPKVAAEGDVEGAANAAVTQKETVAPAAPSTSRADDATAPPESAFAGMIMTPARRRLDALDAKARAELAKPLEQRRLEPLIQGYETVAAESEDDELARRYAQERIRQLRDVESIINTIREMRRLSERADAARRDFLQDRAAIPAVTPTAPSGLDVEATLRVSALYPPDRRPRRYRLVDETRTPPRTIGYVEIPPGFAQPIEPFLNRRVGVRAVTRTWQEGAAEPVPVYVAEELVLLEKSDGATDDAAPQDVDRPADEASDESNVD